MPFGGTNLSDINIAEGSNYFTLNSEGNILLNKTGTEMIYIMPTAIGEGQTSFVVPEGIEKIKSNLLVSYPQITNVSIPASVTELNFGFINSNISEVNINANNPNYISENGRIYNKDVLPDKNKTIVYKQYKNKESITLEEGIKTLAYYSFKNCTNLRTITCPESLIKIEYQAFYALNNLRTVNIGSNATDIHPLSFFSSGNSNINIIIDSNNPKYIGDGAIIYEKNDRGEKYKIVRLENRRANKEMVEQALVNINVIGAYAFRGFTALEKIDIPSTVTEIDRGTFELCNALWQVNIPESVNEIEDGCFAECSCLKEININKSEGSIPGSPWGAQKGNRIVNWLQN